MAIRVGNIVGKFVDWDPNQCSDCSGSCLKIRVELEIAKPLWRWVHLDLGDGEKRFHLEYVNLPHFCLYCGRLSHVVSMCQWLKEGLITEHHYGRWKTLVKNVFNIDPDGQLKGISFGLNTLKPPWKGQASDLPQKRMVRKREDAEGEDDMY